MEHGRKTHAGAKPPVKRPSDRARRIMTALCLVAMLIVTGHFLLSPQAYGAQLPFRSMQLSDNEVSVNANYFLKFFLPAPETLGSIDILFCSNSAFIQDSCTAPTGLDDSAASITFQSGETGFGVSAPAANELLLSRTAAAAGAGFVQYELSGITNPSVSGSYFVRVQTYASTDGTGAANDFGSMAIAFLNNIAISAEVPPFLLFCTGVTITGLDCATAQGDFIDFGELLATQPSHATSQMLVATNAQSGYTITVAGPTMVSGTNTISNIPAADVSRPGTPQFGFNLRSNSTPGGGTNPFGPGTGVPTAGYDQPNRYQYNNGDQVAGNPAPENYREYTSSYLVNRPPGQAPGIYVTTLTYIALATF